MRGWRSHTGVWTKERCTEKVPPFSFISLFPLLGGGRFFRVSDVLGREGKEYSMPWKALRFMWSALLFGATLVFFSLSLSLAFRPSNGPLVFVSLWVMGPSGTCPPRSPFWL